MTVIALSEKSIDDGLDFDANGLVLYFKGNKTGTFDLHKFDDESGVIFNNSVYLLESGSVTISKYGGITQKIEGTFTATFKEYNGSKTLNISAGSFSVIRIPDNMEDDDDDWDDDDDDDWGDDDYSEYFGKFDFSLSGATNLKYTKSQIVGAAAGQFGTMISISIEFENESYFSFTADLQNTKEGDVLELNIESSANAFSNFVLSAESYQLIGTAKMIKLANSVNDHYEIEFIGAFNSLSNQNKSLTINKLHFSIARMY